MNDPQGVHIHITGVVQGVGFRPFVFSLATRLALFGWVRNTSAGVDIEVDGSTEAVAEFVKLLRTETPSLAQIDEFIVEPRAVNGFTTFEIIQSESIAEAFQPISPDVSVCPDCLRELFDPQDRRFRYPFINCTNCGPRFTIIEDIPYDRPKTTMADFEMCPDCSIEYRNPLDRRFHAQPVACPVCGPQVWIETGDTSEAVSGDEAIQEAQALISQGKILAIKGLGGFHLACDALNDEAVSTLRSRKLRVDKPFALMMPDIETIEEHCFVNAAERELLSSRARPIVILRRRSDSPISTQVAPGQDTLGVMLPYTPLHYLLIQRVPTAPESGETTTTIADSQPQILIMTSGNLSEEPIASDNSEALQRLSGLADAFLMHNRAIHIRCDDSVMRVLDLPAECQTVKPDPGKPKPMATPLRRSRGYSPFPVYLPWGVPPLLATGAELKNTFCITRERYAFLSHHIGDLENYETLLSFEKGITHFERLFRVRPEAVAYDLHPDYLATRYALERARNDSLPAFGVQHHHAHLAACMVEHGLDRARPVLGVAFDGTGFGEDGAIWGGEFLLSSYTGFQRLAHLKYIPLPGGDRAVREPWRVALAWLDQAGLDWEEDLPPLKNLSENDPTDRTDQSSHPHRLEVLKQQIRTGLNAPSTSSMGRLFDAAAALAGIRQNVNYEAQAAIELEAHVDPDEPAAYPFSIVSARSEAMDGSNPVRLIIDPAPLFQAIVTDLRSHISTSKIAARFHNGVSEMVNQVLVALRASTGISEVALSGGVWQNTTLLYKTLPQLCKNDFKVYIHQQIPPNDGGVSLGQAAIASQRLKGGAFD